MNMPATYLHDTWGPLKYAASWCFDASGVGWPGEAVARFYCALGEGARVRSVRIESGDFGPGDVHDLAPAEGHVSAEQAAAHVRAFNGQIGALALGLEFHAYVREREDGPPR